MEMISHCSTVLGIGLKIEHCRYCERYGRTDKLHTPELSLCQPVTHPVSLDITGRIQVQVQLKGWSRCSGYRLCGIHACSICRLYVGSHERFKDCHTILVCYCWGTSVPRYYPDIKPPILSCIDAARQPLRHNPHSLRKLSYLPASNLILDRKVTLCTKADRDRSAVGERDKKQ